MEFENLCLEVLGGYTVSGSGGLCKSLVFRLGWFDSISAHYINILWSGIHGGLFIVGWIK